MIGPTTDAAGEVLAFLCAVRRQLRMQQLTDALHAAAKVSLGLMLGLVALHFAVRALSGLWLSLALVLPALGAVCCALLRQPDIGRAALHADRALGGHSGFATCREFLVERRGTPSAAARTALEKWSRGALGAARQRLRQQRIQGLRATIVTTASAALVALAALVLPGRQAPQPVSIARPATAATVPAAGAPAVARQDPAAALQRALREARALDAEPGANPARRATVAAPPRTDGARVPSGERPRSPVPARGAGDDGEGRHAGAGAGAQRAAARPGRVLPAPRSTLMREIHAQHPAPASAAGTIAAELSAGDAALADTLAFDRRQMALARGAAAARMDARADSFASGPAAAALLRRWSQRESSP